MLTYEDDSPIVATDANDPQPQSYDTIRLRVWHGTVHVIIPYNDLTLVLDIPRLTYFPLTYRKIREYFDLQSDTEFQLTCPDRTGRGQLVVLQTHLPVGLLHDLYADCHASWTITLNLSRDETGPAIVKTGDSAMDELRCVLWNSLKENEFLRRYSIRRIQNLTPGEAQELYQSMIKLDFIEYSVRAKTLTSTEELRFVPVRLYLTAQHTVQDLIPTRTHGEHSTTRHVLHKLVPDLAKLGQNVVDVILHGVVVLWDVKLRELLEEATYVDGWLYLTIRLHSGTAAKAEQEKNVMVRTHSIDDHSFTDQFS